MKDTYFDGGVLERIGLSIVASILTFISFGILLPFGFVLIKRYEINHTVINGKRLQFKGKAVGLFGNYIKWFLLCLITFGIYGFWVPVKLLQWQTENTVMVDDYKSQW